MTKMGNIVHRAGIETTYLTFQANMLSLHHVGFPDVTTMLTSICQCNSCLRGQCRLLQYYNDIYIYSMISILFASSCFTY